MDTIKAIPTEYGSQRYRSRTEARWAIYFDLLGIRYEYEPVKVFTGITNYIPDFVLPDLHTILEVKGTQPTLVEQERLAGLCLPGVDYRECWRIVTTGSPDKPLLTINRFSGDLCAWECYLNQCAYCGQLGWFLGKPQDCDKLTETRDITPNSHRNCAVAYATSQIFDIEYDFYSIYQPCEGTPEHPGISPAVQLAIAAACSISFDNPNLYEILEIHTATQAVLRKSHTFTSSKFLHELYPHLLNMRMRSEVCPRFDGAPGARIHKNENAFEIISHKQLDQIATQKAEAGL